VAPQSNAICSSIQRNVLLNMLLNLLLTFPLPRVILSTPSIRPISYKMRNPSHRPPRAHTIQILCWCYTTTLSAPTPLARSHYFVRLTSSALLHPHSFVQTPPSELLRQHIETHISVGVLLHHFRNCHLEIILRNVDTPLPQREHTGLCTDGLALGAVRTCGYYF
jgi:hypothetical protein